MPDQSDNIISEIQSVERFPFFVPRPDPSAIPEVGIFDDPLVCLIINQKWAAHFRGVIEALDQPDTWIGTEEEIEAARQQIREALVKFGQECMICCDDTNELLEQIRDLNQTLVTNQITLITNNETITANQYITQYQSFVSNNQNINILNEMLYDGTPQSISPELGEDFGGTSDLDAALCAAIKSYIDTLVYVFAQQAAMISGVLSVITGIGLALGPATIGASLIGVAIVGAIGGGAALWNSVINDPEAKRKVACCMFDALKDVPISQEAFQASAGSCDLGGAYESNAGFLAAQINGVNQLDENWLAFVRALGQSQGAGDTAPCECGCDDVEDFEFISDNGAILTRIDDTHLRVQQDEFTTDVDGRRYYRAHIRESFLRCVLYVSSTSALSYYTVTDCEGVVGEGPGGFTPGEYVRAQLIIFEDAPYTTGGLDTILEIACPTE